jgi:hypothetical protein
MPTRIAKSVVTVIAALGAAGIAVSPAARAEPADANHSLQELRKMITPCAQAERDYLTAREIWERMNAPNGAPADPRLEPPPAVED